MSVRIFIRLRARIDLSVSVRISRVYTIGV